MPRETLLKKIKEHLDIITDCPLKFLFSMRQSEIANFIEELDQEDGLELFLELPKKIQNDVFISLSVAMKVSVLNILSDSAKVKALQSLHMGDLTTLFDYFSDEELKKSFYLLYNQERQKVLSCFASHPKSASKIMKIDVLSLIDVFTVEQGVKILQRIRPKQEMHREVYITNIDHKLVGYIFLEDLVLHSPETRISSFMNKNEFIAQMDEDREKIANKMVDYTLMTVPVVGENNYFLGIIPSNKLVYINVPEITKNVQQSTRQTYLDTPFLHVIYQRSPILITLLIVESLTATVMHSYEGSIPLIMTFFVATLVNAGGGASHQTSTVIIQGLTTGEINRGNIFKFLRREFFVAITIAIILGTTGFIRAYFVTKSILQSFVVGISLGAISLLAIGLGSFVPLGLKKLNLDPAFSAGPFLATIVDILGILIYCIMIQIILS